MMVRRTRRPALLGRQDIYKTEDLMRTPNPQPQRHTLARGRLLAKMETGTS